MVFGEQKQSGVLCSLDLMGDFALRGLEKGITLTFQRYVIVDAKRQYIGSVKVNIDLCQ